jgi:hypothetical protein
MFQKGKKLQQRFSRRTNFSKALSAGLLTYLGNVCADFPIVQGERISGSDALCETYSCGHSVGLQPTSLFSPLITGHRKNLFKSENKIRK